ncbi:hypothetical protein Cgig2_020718 [Carnegiea gigantea]|uniref:PPM-type phosphatase domain-containing protein n=1 Tax=Carnegiea gigantea TaxID=171969 RepID=A0A9Q1JJ88_9CARY|nr:hypothetical protein Cgig2_020718 [Carnegiea gigantea]
MGAYCSKEGDQGSYRDQQIYEYEQGCDEESQVMKGDCGAFIRFQGCVRFSVIKIKTLHIFPRNGGHFPSSKPYKNVNVQDFTGEKGVYFCGVFDGCKPSGHEVAHQAQDQLPMKLSTAQKLYCKCCQTGDNLIIGNLGDSREIMCTRREKQEVIPVQLTIALKPSLPQEAKRVKRCNSRVFSHTKEPAVLRLWLPDKDYPGLAWPGLSETSASKTVLSAHDEFVVLATVEYWQQRSDPWLQNSEQRTQFKYGTVGSHHQGQMKGERETLVDTTLNFPRSRKNRSKVKLGPRKSGEA